MANLNRFRYGWHVHCDGYLRYSAGPNRNKFVHRVVMEEIIGRQVTVITPEGCIPKGMTVEHLDHDKQHNCRENLMLLDSRIHNWISWESVRNREAAQAAEPPDWVTAA